MEFIIDTADLKAIRRIVEFFPVIGVTTNPTIISKEKTDFKQLALDLREAVGPDKQVHIQTTSEKAEDIVAEAKALYDLVGGEFYIKIPIGAEGLKATMMLKKKGIGVTMTAIHTPQQALQAALETCGEKFLTVTPGVRFADGDVGDQKRVMTPAQAKKIGSDYIVVGRPITAADDPVAAYRRCVAEFCD